MAKSRTSPGQPPTPGLGAPGLGAPSLDRAGDGAAQGGPFQDPVLDATHDATLAEARKAAAGALPDGEDWASGAVHRGRLRVRTLVTLRWLVVAGEAGLLLIALALRLSLPYPLAFAVAAASAWVNLLTGRAR